MSNFSINLVTGEFTNPIFTMGYDVFPLWMNIGADAARKAEAAAGRLDEIWDGSGRQEIVSLLEAEIRASMQCIVAVAAAIDGFYGSAIARAPLKATPSNSKRPRGRHRVILSYFQQKFAIDNQFKQGFEKPLRDIFEFRHAALHSHGKPEELGFHPRHKISMPKKAVVFRAENARIAFEIGLKVICYLMISPRSKFIDLAKHCHASRNWMIPIVSDWLDDHTMEEPLADWFKFGPTRAMFERKGLLPHWKAPASR